MRIRRPTERYDYYEDQPFDEQVWPVMVALGVSCVLAVGAVATLMDGAWMWTMLLLLPALAIAAHFALAEMDDSRLKRSLQLAALTSLSVHLAIMLFTSAVSIFHGPEPLPVQKVVQRRSRSIEVTRRSNPFPWQKVVSQPIPEPDIKVKKKDTLQTDVNPQTHPTLDFTPTRQPQLVRQKRTRKSVSRFSESMSELKRSIVDTTSATEPVQRKRETSALASTARKTVADATDQPAPATPQLASKPTAASEASESTASPTKSREKTERQVRQIPRPTAIAKQADLAAAARPSAG